MRKLLSIVTIMAILFTALVVTGCDPQRKVRPSYKSEFDNKIEEMIYDVVRTSQARVSGIAPAAIVSTAALDTDKRYTRLDEVIAGRLESKLSAHREIVQLSRENFFELREGKPLSLKGHSYAHSDLLEGSLIYIVDVDPDEVLEQIKVSITAKGANGRNIPGLTGETLLKYFEKSPGTLLLAEPAKSNPVPDGLKENPYGSLEQLCYSLASELQASLRRGVKTGQVKAADDEIQVVLCSSSFVSTNPRFKDALIQELQHALASMEGMTCSVSIEDFGPVFRQIDFYKRHSGYFELDNERFKPGSVLLMAETKSQAYTRLKHVALKALWRVTPLKDNQGRFVVQNSAGTYVSGFTSRAWFNGDIPTVLKKGSYRPYPNSQPQEPPFNSDDKGFD